jgi:hypothetical protein
MTATTALRTEFEFTLPVGWTDSEGQTHRDGAMRLATARDEIEPLRDPEVRRNEAYLSVLLLSRTVLRVGPVTEVTPELVEGLYAADFDHLQRLYERLNMAGAATGTVACPDCRHRFDVDLSELEEAPSGK